MPGHVGVVESAAPEAGAPADGPPATITSNEVQRCSSARLQLQPHRCSQWLLLPLRFSVVSAVFPFSASAIAAAPLSLMYAFGFDTDVPPPRMAFTAVFFARYPVISCWAALLIPGLLRRGSDVTAVLTSSAAAIAAAPLSPMLLLRRSSDVSAVLLSSASTIAAAPLSPMVLCAQGQRVCATL